MNKIIFIALCLSFAMVIGVFLALGVDVYRKMKGVNMSFLVYHKNNTDDTPIDLTFDGKKFIAVLSSQYTKEDLQKLVDDGVLIPEMLNFAQKRVKSSFMLNEYKFNTNYAKQTAVSGIWITSSDEQTRFPFFTSVKDFEKAKAIAMKK